MQDNRGRRGTDSPPTRREGDRRPLGDSGGESKHADVVKWLADQRSVGTSRGRARTMSQEGRVALREPERSRTMPEGHALKLAQEIDAVKQKMGGLTQQREALEGVIVDLKRQLESAPIARKWAQDRIRKINKERDLRYNDSVKEINRLEDVQEPLEEKLSRLEQGGMHSTTEREQAKLLREEIQNIENKMAEKYKERDANNTRLHPDTQETIELKRQITLHDKTIEEKPSAIERAEEKLREVNASITKLSGRQRELRRQGPPPLE